MPTFDQVKADVRPSDTRVLDRYGETLQRQRTDPTLRRGAWVTLSEVSPALRTALVLSEDRRFYEHSGVDWRAVSAAAWGHLWHSRTRGASTLTMQLAGLLDSDWRAGPGGRSLGQKLGQAVAAQQLEARWRKDQILEAYLNLVPLRGEIVGIDALARGLFGKAPHGLDGREAAIAVALVRAPNAPAAAVSRRACGVLRALEPAAGARDCDGLDLQVTAVLRRREHPASDGLAPHLARHLLAEARRATPATAPWPPATLRTTLDARLQRHALQTLQRHLRELRGRQVEDGALVVLDNRSGEVLAWVGSSGELSAAAEVDGVLAPRQPGSTLKPFLYAQALAERRLTAASLLEDAPTHIPTPGGLYIPQNYDRQYKGWVSVRTALGASLNVPAVRTLVMVSPDAFARQLAKLGLPLPQTGDWYGTSLALGSADVRLLDLANAYRSLANGGRVGAVTATPVTPGRERPTPRTGGPGPVAGTADRPAHPAAPAPADDPAAIDPRAAFIVADILADPNARARTFGTDSVLATRFWSAVKTGTSKDMRDNWALGFSRHYTVGVWVGNASGAPMHDVSGTSGAAPVWAAVMQYLHRDRPSNPPPPPPGLQHQVVRFAGDHEAAREEWFLAGTAQAVVAMALLASGDRLTPVSGPKDRKSGLEAAPEGGARITAPADGTILALDPDIPPARQRLRLAADQAAALWRINGQPLARGASAQWAPLPGTHRISLHTPDGRELDAVRVEVRGARLNAAGRRALAPSGG